MGTSGIAGAQEGKSAWFTPCLWLYLASQPRRLINAYSVPQLPPRVMGTM